MVSIMKPHEVFEFYGGKAGTARTLGISYEAVRKWELAGRVPDGRQFQIEIKTAGALKSDQDAASASAA